MNTKSIIIISMTLIFILLSIILVYFQYNEMINAKIDDANKITMNLVSELDKNKISDNPISTYPKDFLFAIWVNKDNSKWYPIVYENKLLALNNLTVPENIPDIIRINTLIYYKKINNYEVKIWLNKFNINYYSRYIFISVLFLILIYLIILFIIFLFFRKDPVVEAAFDKTGNYKTNLESDLEEYKKLWEKNFKISTDFKSEFPFKKICDLISIGIKPEQYIKDSLEIAKNYFEWENPKLFIFQKDCFVDINTKEILDNYSVNISVDGKKKGKIYIPLFPYKTTKIYGYLYFEWNNEKNFFISDILYFLKYLFSENAKFIFINNLDIENLINVLNTKLDKQKDLFLSILEVDGKEKIISNLNEHQLNKLNNQILNKLNNLLLNELIYSLANFLYIIIGFDFTEEKKTDEIEHWIKDVENQHYKISNDYGDIAVTFSCGIIFKEDRDLHPLTIISEAESKLKTAKLNGGNQIQF